jgi:hypothetical protein
LKGWLVQPMLRDACEARAPASREQCEAANCRLVLNSKFFCKPSITQHQTMLHMQVCQPASGSIFKTASAWRIQSVIRYRIHNDTVAKLHTLFLARTESFSHRQNAITILQSRGFFSAHQQRRDGCEHPAFPPARS